MKILLLIRKDPKKVDFGSLSQMWDKYRQTMSLWRVLVFCDIYNISVESLMLYRIKVRVQESGD